MTESSIESEKYYSKYEEKHFLGKGAFSKVKLGINKETKEKVAIKIISKSLIKDLEMSLYMANRQVINLSKPYDLTINDRQEVIKSLKELKAILEEYKEPVKIELKEKTLGKRKK